MVFARVVAMVFARVCDNVFAKGSILWFPYHLSNIHGFRLWFPNCVSHMVSDYGFYNVFQTWFQIMVSIV